MVESQGHVRLLVTPGTVARPLCPWDFPGQEYWNGSPLDSPGHLPNPGIESMSPVLQADSLPLSHQGSPSLLSTTYIYHHVVQVSWWYWGFRTYRRYSVQWNSNLPYVSLVKDRGSLPFHFHSCRGSSSEPWGPQSLPCSPSRKRLLIGWGEGCGLPRSGIRLLPKACSCGSTLQPAHCPVFVWGTWCGPRRRTCSWVRIPRVCGSQSFRALILAHTWPLAAY